MNIVITCNGLGKRFENSNYIGRKPFIKIFEKFMIEYVIDNLEFDKNENCFFILHNVEFEKEIEKLKFKYDFIKFISIKQETRGSVDTLRCCLDYIKQYSKLKNILILDCDSYYTVNIIELIQKQNDNCLINFIDDELTCKYSYICVNDNNVVYKIKEKELISDIANTGAYYFINIDILEKYIQITIDNEYCCENKEFYFSNVIDTMIKDKQIFKSIKIEKSQFISLGTPYDVDKYVNKSFLYLFDLDGTLIDSDDLYYNIWKTIFDKYNVEFDNEIYLNYIYGNVDENVYKIFFKDKISNLQELSDMKDEIYKKNINLIKPISNSFEFMKILKNHLHKVGIVSNCNKNILNFVVDYFHLKPDVVICGNDCKNPKPFPDPYIEAKRKIGIADDRVIIFEDSKTGLLSARSCGSYLLFGIKNKYNKEYIDDLCNIVIDNYNNYVDNIYNFYDLIRDYKKSLLKTVKNNIISNLSKNYDILDVCISKDLLKGGYISDVITIDITLTNFVHLFTVLKLENTNVNVLTDMSNKLCLYEREYYFYKNIYNYVNVKVPAFYAIIKNNEYKDIGILLENLNNNSFKLNLNLNKEDISVIFSILDSLSNMHSQFWNKNVFNLKKCNTQNYLYSNFIKENKDEFIKKWFKKLVKNKSLIHKLSYILEKYKNIEDYQSDKNLTLIHGDVKSPNIFYKIKPHDQGYEPYFIDWQYILYGKCTMDVVFLMIESLKFKNIKKYFNVITEYYYLRMIEKGVAYDKNDYLKDLKYSILYFPLFVCVWFGTVNNEMLIDKKFPTKFIKKTCQVIEEFIDDNFLKSL